MTNCLLFRLFLLWAMRINPKSCTGRMFTKLFQVPRWGLWVVTEVIGASIVLLQLVLGYRVTMLPRTTVVWPQSKDELFCGDLCFQSMYNKRTTITKQVRRQYNHRTWWRWFCVAEDESFLNLNIVKALSLWFRKNAQNIVGLACNPVCSRLSAKNQCCFLEISLH